MIIRYATQPITNRPRTIIYKTASHLVPKLGKSTFLGEGWYGLRLHLSEPIGKIATDSWTDRFRFHHVLSANGAGRYNEGKPLRLSKLLDGCEDAIPGPVTKSLSQRVPRQK